ncbi:monocarboxylate transporter 12-like isoform X2 [Amphiura filiformis]
MITSTLTDSLSHIIATYSVLGLGLGIAFLSVQSILVFNFDKHLGTANSFTNCGAGFGMFVMPPVFRFLLHEFGWRGCLFISAGIYANICVCGAFLRPSPSEKKIRNAKKEAVKNTVADGQTSDLPNNNRILSTITGMLKAVKKSFDISLFYTNAQFVAYFIVGFLCGMCVSPVMVYLAPKAVDSGLTKTEASLLLSLLGLGNTVGRFAGGFIADYGPLSTSTIYGFAYFATGLSTILLPFGDTFAVLASISLSLGFSGGSCHGLHLLVAKEFVGLDKASGALSWFYVNFAIGCAVNIFLAGCLVDLTGSYHASLLTAGGFGLLAAVILFTEPRLQQLYQSRCKRRAVGQEESAEYRHEQLENDTLHSNQVYRNGQERCIDVSMEISTST